MQYPLRDFFLKALPRHALRQVHSEDAVEGGAGVEPVFVALRFAVAAGGRTGSGDKNKWMLHQVASFAWCI